MQPPRSRQPGRHRPSVRKPDPGDIELWRTLRVNRGVLGVSAEVMAQCRGGDQVCDLVDLLPDLAGVGDRRRSPHGTGVRLGAGSQSEQDVCPVGLDHHAHVQ